MRIWTLTLQKLAQPGHRWHAGAQSEPSPFLRQARLGYRCRMPRRHSFGINKDYVCSFAGCGKSFYQKRNLLRHQRLKHQAAAAAEGGEMDNEQNSSDDELIGRSEFI